MNGVQVRILVIVSFLLVSSGCQTVPTEKSTHRENAPAYLTSKDILDSSFHNWMWPEDDYWQTEEAKIRFLIRRAAASPFAFIRNGTEYTGAEGSKFLSWKLNLPRWRPQVKTAQDFVDIVCRGSAMSGEPYEVMLQDGSRLNFRLVMQNELDALETFLQKYKVYLDDYNAFMTQRALNSPAAGVLVPRKSGRVPTASSQALLVVPAVAYADK